MSQHRRYRAVERDEFKNHAGICRQCNRAAPKLADAMMDPIPDDQAIKMVVRLCCVQGAVILLEWMRQESPARYVETAT